MKKHNRLLILTIGLVFAVVSSASAQENFRGAGGLDLNTKSDLESKAISSMQSVNQGESFYVAFEFKYPKKTGWYAPFSGYTVTKGGKVITEADANLKIDPDGCKVEEIRWQKGTQKSDPNTGNPYIYKGSTIVIIKLKVPSNAKPTDRMIKITAQGQLCSAESCTEIQPDAIGASASAYTKVMSKNSSTIANPKWKEYEPYLKSSYTREELKKLHAQNSKTAESKLQIDRAAGEQISFGYAIFLALISGLILNIMPCVLPVIPIRILSLVNMSAGSRRRYVTLGLAFVLGMMLFFSAVAGINIALKLSTSTSGGFEISQVLQDPTVVVVMTVVLVAVAANLFGIFNVIVPGKVANLETKIEAGKAGHIKSIGMGFMMAILATPCSFGFLLTALGFAQVAPLVQGTLVILAVGVGMSFPHLILASFPKLIDWLPKPGAWMEYFKHTCGYLILLVAVFLISFLRGDSYKDSYPFWVIAWCIILTMGLWMWSGWVRYDSKFFRKFIIRGIAVVIVAGTGWLLLPYPDKPLLAPMKFNPAEISQAQNQKRVLVVKFTSKICSKCIEQDKEVFNTPEVRDAFKKYNAIFMVGSLSKDNPAQKWLKDKTGSVSVPITFIFPADGSTPKVFTSDLSKEKLINAIRKSVR